jgi:hypothetical protein
MKLRINHPASGCVAGLYKMKTHSLKPPAYNLGTYEVKILVSEFAFKFNLYRYSVGSWVEAEDAAAPDAPRGTGSVITVGLYKLNPVVDPTHSLA